MANTLLATVTSSSSPQSGQKNRSSGNFTTEDAPSNTRSLVFSVSIETNPNASAISFNVMEDKSVQKDPTVYSGVKSGTTVSYKSSRSFYIANPSGAGGQNFTVLVYASPD